MRRLLSILILLVSSSAAQSQHKEELWRQSAREPQLPHASAPEQAVSFRIEETELRARLAAASNAYEGAIIIQLPAPDGSLRSFRVWNTPVMAPELAKQFPQINSYTAEAVGAAHVTAKLDYSPGGFHALIFDGPRTYFIEPAGLGGNGHYLVFYQRDLPDPAIGKACGVQDLPGGIQHSENIQSGESDQPAQRINGTIRRTYRLALACTGEYSVAVAGASPTKAAVMAILVGTVGKVNGIFEREFSASLQLIANEANIIYLNGTTDPYTNSSTSTMLGENQLNLDNVIGSANYDIGHALNVSSLGLGQLGCVCSNGSKARGVTFNAGVNTYQIIAHEMGHQFNAHHTFNGSAGSCSGNGSAAAAFEPGGGSTIMAYPGICSTDNIQSHRDNYYHGKSLEDISTFIAGSGSCAATSSSNNTNASIAPLTATYAIPYKTPFELTAPQATDATQDSLSWCWEERDLGSFGLSLAQTQFYGPLFRTFPPGKARTRVFPRIESLIGRMPMIGEKLPEVARSLAFRVTERDMFQGWGAFNYPEDSIRLNVIDTKAPFTVTYPKGGEWLASGSRPAVRWNVANTTLAPINCPKVDVYLSVDSGMTYPYLLLAGTSNDGVETILLPTITATTLARIKVKCSNNVFFNISGGDFTFYSGTLDAAQLLSEELVQISPVPARDIVNIKLNASLGNVKIRVLNTLGQGVWSGQATGHATLDVSGWAAGMYQVSMLCENGTQSWRKLIIQ